MDEIIKDIPWGWGVGWGWGWGISTAMCLNI